MTIFVYIDQFSCYCVFIYSNFHWQSAFFAWWLFALFLLIIRVTWNGKSINPLSNQRKQSRTYSKRLGLTCAAPVFAPDRITLKTLRRLGVGLWRKASIVLLRSKITTFGWSASRARGACVHFSVFVALLRFMFEAFFVQVKKLRQNF